MVGGEAAAAVEELISGVRRATDFAEQFRTYSESEKQWKARMEFILRHLPDYRDPPDGGGRLDQLLSLSMVWANHLFLGCSYNKDLLDKVMEMADGIEVEDLPQFTTRSKLMKKNCGVLKAVPSLLKATLNAHWKDSPGGFAAVCVCVFPEVFACNRGWQTLSTIASPETKKQNKEP
ncbi:CDKN2AIP N-terminal-like protein isoform X1 [Moschus berezovskii]|uniref:CDKN2AIP N-terminal-like protein isoform X1 n=1 Tax=Moschus berezovskii TaxID=68408 RepID=UPI0024437707|nr:CDKN2AIP N-terminal-like protein isoform X1 [Moschus berezovskii]XP_055287411.1 CDKN2AIP N-terminal-like protein isoform X1 [Moschus berezovskii]